MSNRNTVVKPIRIDGALAQKISEAAKESGLSFNQLAGQVLTKYCESERMAEKLGFVGFSPSCLKAILKLISNEESEMLGRLGGFSGQNSRQLLTALVGRSDVNGLFEGLKLLERYTKGFSAEIVGKDNEHLIILSQSFGMKWSYFLKGTMASFLSENYGLNPEFELTETFMSCRFSLQMAASNPLSV